MQAASLKIKRDTSSVLKGKYLALIFEKSSTRTRVSFEVAMNQLGGKASFLSINDLHLGRGEPLEDTAKVISSMADAVVLRTQSHDTLTLFAKHSSVPVINGLTDLSHPCQLLADLLTFQEFKGDIKGNNKTLKSKSVFSAFKNDWMPEIRDEFNTIKKDSSDTYFSFFSL